VEIELKKSLISLLESIKRGDAKGMSDQMNLVEGFLADGRDRLHPQLVHFLERRSYSKALMFLGGATDIPAGACGGKR
jgi:hypothetical protein